MNEMKSRIIKPNIYISYASGDKKTESGQKRKELVTLITKKLKENDCNVLIDTESIRYKGSLSKFMKRIGQGEYVVLIISDKYLRSEYCMFEVLELLKNKDFNDRIFPIVLEDADIYNPKKIIDYVNHWQKKYDSLNESIQDLKNMDNAGVIFDKLNLYSEIRRVIATFSTIIGDMIVINVEDDIDESADQLLSVILKKVEQANHKAYILLENDAYKLLSLKKGATSDEIKNSYESLKSGYLYTLKQHGKVESITRIIHAEIKKVEDAFNLIYFNAKECENATIQTDDSDYSLYTKETLIKELHKALASATKYEKLKNTFLENISHEIRTPLNTIMGFATMLKVDDINQAERVQFLEIMEESSKRLLFMVDDLLDYSKLVTDNFQLTKHAVNLDSFLEELRRTYEGRNDEQIEFSLENEFRNSYSLVITDPARLQQVINCLLSNAFKFTESGVVKLGAKVCENEMIRFYVRDTGIGIGEGVGNLVFEPFEKLKNENYYMSGLGLGLSISKMIVELMGGKLWYESIKGMGTTFYFDLPIERTDEEHDFSLDTIVDFDGEVDLKGKHLLVVEDDHSNYMFLDTLLRNTNAQISLAENGQEAVELISSNDYDLVLMDLMLPVMDGVQATSQIRKENKDIPIIAQTAYALSGTKERCMEAGFDDYITKPINGTELLYKISKTLNLS